MGARALGCFERANVSVASGVLGVSDVSGTSP